jgi:hypothetical protein
MMPKWIHVVAAAALLAAAPLLVAQDGAGAAEGARGGVAVAPEMVPGPYLRLGEKREGAVLQLQTAVREFVHPDPSRPQITVAAAVHIGEREFYRELQEILNAQDVVLFEGVRPRQFEEADIAQVQADLTRSRMRVLAAMLESYRRERNEYPQELEGMLDLWPEARMGREDAWRNELVYQRGEGDEPSFVIISYGADGQPGGEGPDADIRIVSGEPRRPQRGRPERGGGLQKQLADALGLVFQLEAMDHDGLNWRNSDMSMEELRQRFDEAGVQAEGLFGMLDGSSMMSRFAGVLLGMLGSNQQSQAMLKAVLIDMLSQADLLLGQMPPQAARMMSIIVEERNEVVLADLEQLIRDEPEVRTVGIIYGGGHLAHMERRLTEDFGYRPAGDRWLVAMEVDAETAGIPPAQLRTMRQALKRSMEAQMRRR